MKAEEAPIVRFGRGYDAAMETGPTRESDIAALQRKILAFAAERDWGQFHDPKNLAMAVAVEAIRGLRSVCHSLVAD